MQASTPTRAYAPPLRAQLRAALIALALFVHLLAGLPIPRIQARHLDRPVGQRELARWTQALQSIGVDTDETELRAWALSSSAEAQPLHAEFMGPFAWYFEATNTRQAWSLFPVADPEPWKIVVEGRAGNAGEWPRLFTCLDAERDFAAAMLTYRRIRGVWNPGTAGPRLDYPRFVDWIAREVFAARADLRKVRVRYLRYRVRVPGEEADEDQEEARRPTLTSHFEERRRRPS